MSKFELRIKARDLRSQGMSVKQISQTLGVSKGSASLWVRDIILTIEQLEALRHRAIQGAERGRLKSALMQKKRRSDFIEIEKKNAAQVLNKLSDQEFFTTGLALYWAEGCKKSQRVQLCNSDPRLIIFIIKWLEKFFGIPRSELAVRVGINFIHEGRDQKVREYWSKVTGIPLKQFRKTSFKKVNSKKIYQNFEDHYGTFVIEVLKPTRIYYKIMGFIDALANLPT